MVLDTQYMMSREVTMEEGKFNQFQCHSLIRPSFIYPLTKDLLGIIPSNTRKFILNEPLWSWPETVRLIKLESYVSSPGNPIYYSEVKVEMLYFKEWTFKGNELSWLRLFFRKMAWASGFLSLLLKIHEQYWLNLRTLI